MPKNDSKTLVLSCVINQQDPNMNGQKKYEFQEKKKENRRAHNKAKLAIQKNKYRLKNVNQKIAQNFLENNF